MGDSASGTRDTASQGAVSASVIKNKPLLRPADVLELVPGMVVTQHSGDGKANPYFLRGMNLDHGTDFTTTVNGVPVNMPSHAHGQGYSDLNFLMPELVQRIDYRKGPYFAGEGDFSSAGLARIAYRTRLDQPFADVSLGQGGAMPARLSQVQASFKPACMSTRLICARSVCRCVTGFERGLHGSHLRNDQLVEPIDSAQ